MLLAVDIGNTTIAFGIVKAGRVLKIKRIETHQSELILKRAIKGTALLLKKQYKGIAGIVICSVVPPASATVSSILKEVFKIKPLIVGQDIVVPIKNLYRNPNQVGKDRLVEAYAASFLYGTPLIIIDFGTAITYNIVSAKREYLGGIIVPGIRLSAESLFKKTALLPKVKIKTPKNIIGKTTNESILSGLFYGYGAMSVGLIDKISKTFKSRPQVVVTGGYTHWVKKYFAEKIDVVDEHLIFKGLALLWSSL
ncbi:MAG: hypothetical protein A2Z88_07865 [Omnitrophica WOR_2 bacterium GWA2_47_8]|nr:MAG: hypothetical protein A2Z88_07865 [Omnitrophica WOR_2 bacterium GWA2_47_8]